jgi:toxin secretion/phage lysis holin
MDYAEVLQFSAPVWEIALPAIWALADVITGLIKAQVTNSKNSSKMRTGLYRKAGEIMLVGLAWLFCIAVRFPYDLASYIAAYIVVMETLSIFENLKASGVPIPDFITTKTEHIAEDLNEGKKTQTQTAQGLLPEAKEAGRADKRKEEKKKE